MRGLYYSGSLIFENPKVSCLLLSMQTFMWVLVLLVMTVYVIAIYITQTVYVYRLDNPGNAELADKFGTLWVSMLSVFQSLTGGIFVVVLGNILFLRVLKPNEVKTF